MAAGWQERAEALFFLEKKSIVEIEKELQVSRKSIGAHLKNCPGYQRERERRKMENAVKRVEYKRNWDRRNRSFSAGPVTEETIRREHDVAAMILSREKYR